MAGLVYDLVGTVEREIGSCEGGREESGWGGGRVYDINCASMLPFDSPATTRAMVSVPLMSSDVQSYLAVIGLRIPVVTKSPLGVI